MHLESNAPDAAAGYCIVGIVYSANQLAHCPSTVLPCVTCRRPAMMAAGQHATCAPESIRMPTWIRLLAGESIHVQKWNSPQDGQVHYTDAAARESIWPRTVFSCQVTCIVINCGRSFKMHSCIPTNCRYMTFVI